jgi:hypothetical protein
MNLGFHGDLIYTKTICQTDENGEAELMILLTPEFIAKIKAMEQRIDQLEKLMER